MSELTLEGAAAEQRQGTPLVFRFGGGVNSVAMLIGLRDRGIRPDLVSFSDTGGEKPATMEYLAVVRAWLARNGFPELTVVQYRTRAGDTTLEEYSLRTQTLPSRAYGFGSCATKWKVQPFEKFMTAWPPFQAARKAGVKPIVMLGYDAGEERRAKIHENERYRFIHPLMEWGWDRDACVRAVENEGLPVPPKSACFYCPSSTKKEVLQLAKTHPDLFARAVAIEHAAAPNLHTVKGLGRHWSWEWLVSADEQARKTAVERPVEVCIVCTEDSCGVDDD